MATYDFSLILGDIVLTAFARIQIRRSEVLAEHMTNARIEANLLQAEWSNRGPLLWTVDLQSVSLVEGTKSYGVPAETVMILDAYIGTTANDGTENDRIITALSRTEYASMPNKDQQGSPTSYWFDRLIDGTITMWPVPDANGPYVLKYYRFTQIADVTTAQGGSPTIPYLWLEAYTADLAYRMARIYRPELEAVRLADRDRAYAIAENQGIENVPLYIAPMTSSYWQ